MSITTPTTANTSPHFTTRMGALCGADITSVMLFTISGLLYFLKSIISNLHCLHLWSLPCSAKNIAKICMDTKKGVSHCIYHLEALD